MKNQCTSFVNDWMYSGKLPDRIYRTNTSMVSCSCRTRNQNLNIGWLSCRTVHQSSRLMGSVLGSVDFTCYWSASSNAWCKTQAVTWWARLVRVMCAAFRNESAFPDVATPACNPVLLSNRYFPEDFQQFSRQLTRCAVYRT